MYTPWKRNDLEKKKVPTVLINRTKLNSVMLLLIDWIYSLPLAFWILQTLRRPAPLRCTACAPNPDTPKKRRRKKTSELDAEFSDSDLDLDFTVAESASTPEEQIKVRYYVYTLEGNRNMRAGLFFSWHIFFGTSRIAHQRFIICTRF